jgi:hypothetical protein
MYPIINPKTTHIKDATKFLKPSVLTNFDNPDSSCSPFTKKFMIRLKKLRRNK